MEEDCLLAKAIRSGQHDDIMWRLLRRMAKAKPREYNQPQHKREVLIGEAKVSPLLWWQCCEWMASGGGPQPVERSVDKSELRVGGGATTVAPMTTHIIQLDLTDEEIDVLKAGVDVQVAFARPGLNFVEIDEAAERRITIATNLQDKVGVALRQVRA